MYISKKKKVIVLTKSKEKSVLNWQKLINPFHMTDDEKDASLLDSMSGIVSERVRWV